MQARPHPSSCPRCDTHVLPHLQLHPYTFRDEAYRLTYGSFSTPWDEYELFFDKMGIDGAFTDSADTLKTFFNEKVRALGAAACLGDAASTVKGFGALWQHFRLRRVA